MQGDAPAKIVQARTASCGATFRIPTIRNANESRQRRSSCFPLLASNASSQTAMFRNGPEHSGVYDSPAPTLQTLAWKFKTGGRVISSPLVVGDVVYVGSTDGSLYAINRADGSQRWKFDTKGPVSSSPAFRERPGLRRQRRTGSSTRWTPRPGQAQLDVRDQR